MTENEDKYNLYTEKIKIRPWTKYKKLINLAKIAVLAVFAGVMAAMAFIVVVRLADQKEDAPEEVRHEVTFPMEEYPGGIPSGVLQNQEETVDKTNTETVSATEETNKEKVETVYDVVADIVSELSPCMTTVTAIHKNEDPLFSAVQNKIDFPGIIIADNEVEYLILTDYAIKDVDAVEVTFMDGEKAKASLVMADKLLSVAVIAVEHSDISSETSAGIKIVQMGNSYMLKQGELVIAMGNIHGIKSAVDFGLAVSTKEVAYEADSRHGLIYTNMNGAKECRGFLFNEEGLLIGNISSSYSAGNIVAYGISDIKIRIQNMTNRKGIGYLGVIGQDVTEELAEEYGMPEGVYVSSMEAYSPVYYSGILNGDIITEIGGRTIANVYNLERAMCEFEPGTELTIIVNRRGKDGYVPIEFVITLDEK